MNKINLPQLPEAGMFAEYWSSDMQAYARAAVEKDRAERGGVPDAILAEAANLASILGGMVEGGYSDLNTLYTEDQADGEEFRMQAHEWYKETLTELNIPYIIVDGTVEERVAKVMKELAVS